VKATKIIATIGPASDSPEIIRELILEGVNIFRFNTKHNEQAWHEERIALVQNIANELEVPIGIMLDLQGPEMRLMTREQKEITLPKGHEIDIYLDFKNKNAQLVLPYKEAFSVVEKGDRVLVDDAYVELEVTHKSRGYFTVRAVEPAIIHHQKGVNIPKKRLDLPSLTAQDRKYLTMAQKNKVDFVALSFVRDADDVAILKKEMQKQNIDADVIVKIENEIALENIESVVEASEVVMVARGDLGVEVPIEELAFWQMTIIRLCRQKNKPVITATQMLESMIRSPYPTRAEATDIANAIIGGTDAIMLSGETAAGNYPVRVVKVMNKIAAFNEHKLEKVSIEKDITDRTNLFAKLAVTVAKEEKIPTDKFIVFTQTGTTARALSSLRPDIPIIAVTENQKTVERLTMSYGVSTVKIKFPQGNIRDPEYALRQLRKMGELKEGENIILVHGINWQTPGSTNTLSVLTV